MKISSFNKELKRVHHGGRLHNDQVLVPLILRMPGVVPSNRRVTETVQLVDILPTITDLLNLPKMERVQGKSLLPLMFARTETQGGVAFSEELGFRFNNENLRVAVQDRYRMVSIISGAMKLIHSSDGDELYNLEIDPKETNTLVKRNGSHGILLADELDRFIQVNKPKYSTRPIIAKGRSLSEETKEKLRSLGYIK